jgi:hypothetical protein
MIFRDPISGMGTNFIWSLGARASAGHQDVLFTRPVTSLFIPRRGHGGSQICETAGPSRGDRDDGWRSIRAHGADPLQKSGGGPRRQRDLTRARGTTTVASLKCSALIFAPTPRREPTRF